jgi:putative flippase GtrA
MLIPVLYLLQRNLVFRPQGVLSRMFSRYAIIQLLALATGAVAVGFLVGEAGMASLPAFMVTALIVGGISYTLHRGWTFAYDGEDVAN